jgi:hypothetical protein
MGVPKEVLSEDVSRLINQIWKLIPMREKNENWKNHLNNIIVEISGLYSVLDLDGLILISKLEGLRNLDLDFLTYRSIVFRSITLLNRELGHL